MAQNNVVISITGINNTGPAFNQVRNSAQSTVNSIEKSFATIGNSFKNVGRTMTAAITVPVAGVVGSSVKKFMDFEAQMSKVGALSGAVGEDLQDLAEKAKEMGSKTKFTAVESAQAFEYMAQAGWKTKDMMNGLEGVIKLASASGEDLATVSNIVTSSIKQFGMTAAETGRYADILARAAADSNTDVAMMGESFKYVAPAAETLGYTAEDVGIALGLMANSGITASTAGTSLRTAFTNLANPTKKMNKQMKELGISLTDSKGKTKTFKKVMDEMRVSFAGLTREQQISAAATIFGKNAYTGMLAIIRASEEDYNKLTSAIYSSSDGVGTASEMSEQMINNLSGQITILKSAWEGIQLKIAESVIPTIKQFVEWVQKVADKINAMKPETLDMIVKFALIAATVGPVIWMFGSFITSVLAIIKGVTEFAGAVKFLSTQFALLKIAMAGASATPWGLIISAIGVAVVALGYIIYKNWDKIKECLSSAFNWIKDKWNELSNWLTTQVQNIAKKLGIEKELSVLTNILKDFKWWEFLLPTAPIKLLDGLLKHFFDGNGIIEIVKGVGKKIGDAWNSMMDFFGGIIENIVNFIIDKVNLVKDIVKIIQEIREKIKLLFMGAFALIYTFIKNKIKDVVDLFLDVASPILKSIDKVVKPIIRKIKDMYNNFKSIIKNLISVAKNVINGIKNAFTVGFDFIIQKITGVFSRVREVYNSLKSFYSKIIEFIRPVLDVVNAFKQGFQNMMDKAGEIFSKIIVMFQNFMTEFDNFVTKVKNGFRSFINIIIKGLNHLIKGLQKIKIVTPAVPELNIPAVGIDLSYLKEIPELPELNIGTSEVLKDGLSIIHKGEAVVPAKVNPFTAKNRDLLVKNKKEQQPIIVMINDKVDPITLELDGRVIANSVIKHTRNAVAVRGC